MTFDWSDYLSAAQSLCGQPVSGRPASAEAQQRSGVSRAYYAAYASARNRLRDVEGVSVPTSGAAHGLVANHYRVVDDPMRAEIGVELTRLRLARNMCDYDESVNDLGMLTHFSLSRAAHVLSDLKRL
ncbi:MAG: hypothetical protein EPO26_15365 [Chloroflexota bacterium]|nr:MAG: hypothetical protein EPO26_15365 [Chloroflexota bacterium]